MPRGRPPSSPFRRPIRAGHPPTVLATAAVLAAFGMGTAGVAEPGCAWSPGLVERDDAGSGSARDPSLRLLILPEDQGRTLVDAMAGAQRRVWMEMYLLTDDGAIGALVAAHARGVDVRVLLEPSPYGAETANQPAFSALGRAGVDVRWFLVPEGLVHAKVILVDDGVWISTANLTTAGLDYNRELAVADTDPDDVRRVESLWQSDAIGSPPAAASMTAAGSEARGTRVLASPLDARARLTAAIDGARASIALEVEELSDAEVARRLIAACERGVAVSVVVPARGDRSAATSGTATRLVAAGVEVRSMSGPTLHAKAMTVDDHVAYVGSINFTRASFDDNREIGLLLDDPVLIARVRDTIGQDATRGAPP